MPYPNVMWGEFNRYDYEKLELFVHCTLHNGCRLAFVSIDPHASYVSTGMIEMTSLGKMINELLLRLSGLFAFLQL